MVQVKSTRHRTLLFLPQVGWFLKHHHPFRTSYQLRQWLEGVRARGEWDNPYSNHHALQELGLTVPEAIAWGIKVKSHESFFVSAEVSNSRSLSEYLAHSSFNRARLTVVLSLATQVAAVHRNGWRMPDLHAENLLVAADRLYFIDFHSSRPFLSTRGSRVSDWGTLMASIGHLLSHRERVSLIATYIDALGKSVEEDLSSRITRAAARRLRHQYRGALRRCSPLARDSVPGGGLRVYAPENCVLPDLRCLNPETLSPQVLKRAPRSRVSRCLVGDAQLVVKEYTDSGPKKRLREWLSMTRAEKAYAATAGLTACKISVPEAVSCIVNRQGSDFLWTRFLDDTVALDQLLQKGWWLLPSGQRRALVAATARLMGRLHCLGIFHPDLTAKNFLVRTEVEPRVWLVDLDGVQLKAHLSRRARIKNLAQLNDLSMPVDRKDVVLFVRTYLETTDTSWLRNSLKVVRSRSRQRRRRALRRLTRSQASNRA